MENIVEPTFDFDFSKLYLGSPISKSSGTYFTKILYNNKSLYVQTPKSLTKQGFIKNCKKIYADLMFTNFDNLFIDWIERLQNKCEELLYERSQTWFETKIEKDDIETAFTSPIKVFKSGKNYLIRVNAKPEIKIYDELNHLVELESITNDKNIISILEIQGIKFTSKNFQIEIELKQCMSVSPDPFLDKCFIKNPCTNTNINTIENENDYLNKSSNDSMKDIFLEQNMFRKNDENIIKSNVESNIKNNACKDVDTIDLDLDSLVNMSITKLSTDSKNVGKKYEEKQQESEQINTNEKKQLLAKEKNKKKETLEILKTSKTSNENIQIPTNENILLEVEDIISLSNNDMTEVNISLDDNFDRNDDAIKLKNRSQVYKEIYQKSKDKVKELKNATIVAYMELKNIKSMYMLDDVYDSDSDIEELNSIDLDKDDELNLDI
jgi:hypothetical protein